MAEINRIAWMILFLIGAFTFVWLEWNDVNGSKMAWFMLTSLWSAVCGIGYTILNWFIADRNPGTASMKTEQE